MNITGTPAAAPAIAAFQAAILTALAREVKGKG